MKKIIGILGRSCIDKNNNKFIGISEKVRKSVIKKNCIPLIITPCNNFKFDKDNTKEKLNKEEKVYYEKIVDLCDGIIITGGITWYNYDIYVVKYAIKKDIPVLGICMGMQLLASLDIGEDNLELNTNHNHNIKNKKYVHKIFILDNTILNNIIKTNTLSVNSRHNYHIKIPYNFKISSYSSDGYIESIEMEGKKCVIGLQWHIEDMIYYDKNANKIFDYFISKL